MGPKEILFYIREEPIFRAFTFFFHEKKQCLWRNSVTCVTYLLKPQFLLKNGVTDVFPLEAQCYACM